MNTIEMSNKTPRDPAAGDNAIAYDQAGNLVRVNLSVGPSGGPEVLKDWTASTDIARDLLVGVTLGAAGYEGLVLELRKMTYTGNGSGGTLPADNNLTLALYLTGKVLMDTIKTSYGYRISRGNQGGGNNDSNKPLLSMTSFGLYGCYAKVRFSQYLGASPQWGYSLEQTFLDSNSTLVGMGKGENVSSFSDASNATPTEMWLQGKSTESLSYEYRITRE